MQCRNPYLRGIHAYGCGQCMPCRYNRRRIWTHRMMLEAACHEENCFVTLTYAVENLSYMSPEGVLSRGVPPLNGLPSLAPVDLRNWLKRLRGVIAPIKVRYYAVGEYGDQTERPHYHIALFGYPTCRFGKTRTDRSPCCDVCELMRTTWNMGHVFVGELSVESAQYICGYVTKKMTSKNDSRLGGRYPEFCRMSLKPGIGGDFMHDVASGLMDYEAKAGVQDDVPAALRHGVRVLPLGRYLRRRLRKLTGRDERAPQSTIEKGTKEMRHLYEVAKEAGEGSTFLPKVAIVAAGNQKVRNANARRAIFKKGKML